MENKEWNVYEMHEVLSPTGKPYIGSSCNFYVRISKHKHEYKLSQRPELIIIAGPFSTKKEARRVENEYRVANGWCHENEYCRQGGKAAAKSMTEEQLFNRASKGGKTSSEAMTPEQRSNRSSMACQGKKWINNGIEEKKFYPEFLQEWFNKGYELGRLKIK